MSAALVIPEDDLSRFPVPRVRRAGERIPREVIRERIARAYALEMKEGPLEQESARVTDEGGQRFQHPDIRENVLPLWFDHSATHRPNVWIKYGVPAML